MVVLSFVVWYENKMGISCTESGWKAHKDLAEHHLYVQTLTSITVVDECADVCHVWDCRLVLLELLSLMGCIAGAQSVQSDLIKH